MKNEHKARVVAAKKQTAVLERGAGIQQKKSMLLSAHIPDYQTWADKDHPSTSQTKDAKVLAFFVATVGDKRLDQYSAFDAQRWRAARGNIISKGRLIGLSTLDREFNVLRGCFSMAVEWKRLTKSPFAGIANLSKDQTRIRTLTAEERAIVLQKLPRRWALMCRVTLECLARLSEVLHISRNDLKPTGLQRRLKGGKVETVAVTDELLKDLRGELAPGQHHVFGDPPASPESTSSYFTRMFRALGLDGVSHHTMRHTGVTDMLDAGVNPRVIQKLAGWSSLRMLERYGHTRDTEMQRAVATTAALNRAAMNKPLARQA